MTGRTAVFLIAAISAETAGAVGACDLREEPGSPPHTPSGLPAGLLIVIYLCHPELAEGSHGKAQKEVFHGTASGIIPQMAAPDL